MQLSARARRWDAAANASTKFAIEICLLETNEPSA
jgi:hypothetical protein